MSETNEYNPVTHTTIQKRHIRCAVVGLVAVIGLVVAGLVYYEPGQTVDINGKPVFTVPTLNDLKGVVQFKTPDGNVVQTKVEPLSVLPAPQPIQQSVQQPVVQPNGQTKSTIDNFGPDHRMQRTDSQETRYDPIDRLADKLDTSNVATNKSIDKLADQVSSFGEKVNVRFDDLGSKIMAVDGKVDGAIGRIAKLETAQATPAPTQPAPQATTQPVTPAPSAVTSQATPVTPAPQSAVPAPAATSQMTPAPDAPVQSVAQAQQNGGVSYTGVPDKWHIGQVHKPTQAESCAAKGGTLRLSDYTKGQCTRIPNGGYNCPWICDRGA